MVDFITIFEKFIFPVALSIALLLFIGGGLFLLWQYFTKKEEQYIARLDAAQKRMDDNQEKFLTTIKSQNEITAAIALLVSPIKTSTDLLPVVKTQIEENLRATQHLSDLIRDRKS